MASSVDSYIADNNGGVDWLEPFNVVDYGFATFFSEVQTLVMGRKTFDQARTFGSEWVYKGKRTLVVTSTPIMDPPTGVECWTDGVLSLMKHLRALDDGDVWVVGGSQLQTRLIESNAIDRLQLFVIPILLGDGVPLFHKMNSPQGLSLHSTSQHDMGVIELDYRTGSSKQP